MLYNILSSKTNQTIKHNMQKFYTALTASAYSPGGASVSVTMSSSSLNSGVVVNITPGDREFTVDSVSGLKLNNSYVLKNNYYEQLFSIKQIDGPKKVITPNRAIEQIFASGSVLFDPIVTFTIPDSQLHQLGYRLELSYLDFNGERQYESIPFNAIPYSLKTDLTLEDVAALDPLIHAKLTDSTNFERLKQATWDIIVARVHSNIKLGTLVGTINLTIPHGFLLRSEIALSAGPDYVENRNQLAKRFEEELNSILNSVQTFGNDTGQTSQRQWAQTIRIARA